MASVHGMNDVTHLGFFDIPMLTSIPNLVYLAPTNNEELLAMTKYAVHQQDHPVAIRVPVGEFVSTGVVDTTDYSILHKSQVTRNSIPLMTEHNKELARRLYCGKVWTCDALKFAETYYEHRDN